MDKKLIQDVFEKIQEQVPGIDYAIFNTDDYGDCNTCVNDALIRKFGIDSKGLYLKHWTRDMNREKPLEYQDRAWIAHDLTDEQGKVVLAILKENFAVENDSYDPTKSFVIHMKPAS